jgi:hypothetical protein
MFQGCSNLTSLPANFKLPQGITTVGVNFCAEMFNSCDNANFKVNNAFRFPLLSQSDIDKSGVFRQTFYCDANKTYSRQNISASTILNGNPAPSNNAATMRTFFTYDATQGANRWSDYASLPAQWK